MFHGEIAIHLDDKGRMAIPSALRDPLAASCGSRLVVTYNPWEPGSLWLYPYPAWERVRDQVMALPNARPEHRRIQRMLVGAASIVEPDGNGRLLLPLALRQSVGLERRIVLVGLGSKFEIWDEATYRQQMAPIAADQLTAEIEALTL